MQIVTDGGALGVDLEQVLISDPDTSHVFTAAHGDMGLAAMQIGLVEMVRAAGLTWDGVVGHSAGETACGYADGCTTLEQTLQALEQEYADKAIPRPPHWGGYRVVPNAVEFWQGRPSRLHDRLLYQFEGQNWRVARLFP